MSNSEKRGKKRSKSFYKKCAYGGKRARGTKNVLEPGIKGFLVMCNSNESFAVKESYNILNEYADKIYGQVKIMEQCHSSNSKSSEEESECDDVEVTMKKEINDIKNTTFTERRFQNVLTKAKNCVFIRSTVEDPVKLIVAIMEEIAQQRLKKARFAARMLPIIGTCKAHTHDIEKLANETLIPIFSRDNILAPASYTVLFKVRNNNASTCNKMSVIPMLTKVVSEINPSVKFSWSDFEVAVLVEVVCTVCCLGVAPGYSRLRKYNLQELVQGPKTSGSTETSETEISNKTYIETVQKDELLSSGKTSADAVDTGKLLASGKTSAEIDTGEVLARGKTSADAVDTAELLESGKTSAEIDTGEVLARGKTSADAVDTGELLESGKTSANIDIGELLESGKISADAVDTGEVLASGKTSADAVET